MDRGANCSSSDADCTSDRFSTQFNSTAFASSEDYLDLYSANVNKKPDLKLSPILNESSERRDRRTVYSMRMIQYKCRGQSPLVKSSHEEPLNPLDDISEIHREKDGDSKLYSREDSSTFEKGHSNKENAAPGTSTPDRYSGSSMARHHSRSTNSFDTHILETIHTNTFSPSVFASTGTPPSQEEFKWSIEELSLLKPAHISQEEIAQSSYSPDPEQQAKIQAILDEYWKNNTCFIPSPDVPVKNPLLTSAPQTPLCDMVRINAAMRMKYSTSSPKARPTTGSVSSRTSFLQSHRNKQSQTEFTIAPSIDFDFSQYLGPSCIYNFGEELDESVFNATGSSTGSLRRRLFIEEDETSPSCTSTDLGDRQNRSPDDDNQEIRYDLEGYGNNFNGFDLELSPIKHL